MAKFCSLFSGSKANCSFICEGKNGILIDAGASCAATVRALSEIGADISNVKAIFITHEHSDHIKGVSVLSKKYDIPVYSSKATVGELRLVSGERACRIDNGCAVEVAGFKVSRFSVSHDCVDPGGYNIELSSGAKISVCTDLGFVSDDVLSCLLGSRLVLIESNHDIKMLEHGPYPAELKLRIASKHGHLSNTACAAVLPRLLMGGTTHFVLGHLSENNNTPMLAHSCAKASLLGAGARENDFVLTCAMPSNNDVIYI